MQSDNFASQPSETRTVAGFLPSSRRHQWLSDRFGLTRVTNLLRSTGQQDYAARLTAEEAAALVIISEAKWDAKHSFGSGDERGVEFNGTYDTVLESDAVCVGAALIDHSDLRGIVFPWCYCSEFGYCPASFVFKCSDALSDDGRVLWDRVCWRWCKSASIRWRGRGFLRVSILSVC